MNAPAAVPKQRKPDWIRVKAPVSEGYHQTRRLMRELNLATVCEEAACPNIGECWTKKHATVMILGDTCTRACAFCNVKTGMPRAVDPLEPEHVATAAAELGLEHIVVTSVDRDDLPDGGASQFVKVIEALRKRTPSTTIEILTPDFRNKSEGAVEAIVDAGPDVYNHNLETVPRLYPTIRPGARYYASLRLLESVKRRAPHMFTKSGLMVGLGEQRLEVHQVMDDMRSAGVDFLTMGQYLQPTPRHARVEEFVTPQAFDAYAAIARAKGFLLVAASPLTRSSYHAGDDFRKMQAARLGAIGAFERLMPRHSETKYLPYTPEQLFELVADVEHYDEFLPWVVAVRVRSSSDRETVADLVVGFNAFKERFTSRVVKERPSADLRRLRRRAAQISPQRVAIRSFGKRRDRRAFLGRFRFQVTAVRNARGSDVRPGIAANDERLRAARSRALRHQQLERTKRRLKADPGAGLFVEELVVGDDLRRIGVALGASEDDRSDRLLRGPAARARDPGDGNRDIGVGSGKCATRHRPGRRDADCAERVDHVLAHLELGDLCRVRVGHITGFEHIGRARNLGERRTDEAARAALGNCDSSAELAIGLHHFARLVDQFVGEERVLHCESGPCECSPPPARQCLRAVR